MASRRWGNDGTSDISSPARVLTMKELRRDLTWNPLRTDPRLQRFVAQAGGKIKFPNKTCVGVVRAVKLA
jgi:hypothetical protein